MLLQNSTMAPEGSSQTKSMQTDEQQEVYYPSIKVIVIQLGLLTGFGTVVIGLFRLNPGIVGGGRIADIVISVVLIILGLSIFRLLIKIVVLRRTEYMINNGKLRREYKLFYKTKTREVPLEQLRGMEMKQNRIQALLNHGTITFLTAGTNQSLGFLEFENVREPAVVRDRIRNLVSKRSH